MVEQIDTSHLTDVYADGIACVDNLGVNFRQIFFVFSRQPSGLLAQVAVASIVRPQSSLGNKTGGLAAMLRMQSPPNFRPAWGQVSFN